jgi:hypothetical protein
MHFSKRRCIDRQAGRRNHPGNRVVLLEQKSFCENGRGMAARRRADPSIMDDNSAIARPVDAEKREK